MPLSEGARLGGYEIVGHLGAGGMGEVYRARDTKLNRDVAIKVLPELFAADPERLARFEREAQSLAALNHPNIAQIYGVLEKPAALVMECVEGEDLAQRMARGPIELHDAVPIARRSPRVSRRRTSAASSIAISNLRTSSSRRTAPSRSSTSAWRSPRIRPRS